MQRCMYVYISCIMENLLFENCIWCVDIIIVVTAAVVAHAFFLSLFLSSTYTIRTNEYVDKQYKITFDVYNMKMAYRLSRWYPAGYKT